MPTTAASQLHNLWNIGKLPVRGDFIHMPNHRFLLIKGLSHNFWANAHQTAEMLLAAELTGRIPVVHWGTECQHNGVVYNSAFDMYFEPISAYSMDDVSRPDYTYDPPTWRYDNLTIDDAGRFSRSYRNAGQIMDSVANVVVSDISIPVKHFLPWITTDHAEYGMSPDQIYRYLFRKYLHLKPDIGREIQELYASRLNNAEPVMAVHLPGDLAVDIYPQILQFHKLNNLATMKMPNLPRRYGKIRRTDRFLVDETTHLHEIVRLLPANQIGDPYRLFHPEIRHMLGKNAISKIFLSTDREEIVEQFAQLYGPMLVYNGYERIPKNDARNGEPSETHLNARRKGLDAVKDAYLAARCDFFVGYGGSHLSLAVSRLKDWPETNLKLMYWMLPKYYNFSYEMIKTGRYAPEEFDGKYRLFMKRAANLLHRVKRAFQ